MDGKQYVRLRSEDDSRQNTSCFIWFEVYSTLRTLLNLVRKRPWERGWTLLCKILKKIKLISEQLSRSWTLYGSRVRIVFKCSNNYEVTVAKLSFKQTDSLLNNFFSVNFAQRTKKKEAESLESKLILIWSCLTMFQISIPSGSHY